MLQEDLVAKSSKKVGFHSAISEGTVFRPATTHSPSLEHKVQNCHDLHKSWSKGQISNSQFSKIVRSRTISCSQQQDMSLPFRECMSENFWMSLKIGS